MENEVFLYSAFVLQVAFCLWAAYYTGRNLFIALGLSVLLAPIAWLVYLFFLWDGEQTKKSLAKHQNDSGAE